LSWRKLLWFFFGVVPGWHGQLGQIRVLAGEEHRLLHRHAGHAGLQRRRRRASPRVREGRAPLQH
jgi:hypothetical protein